MSPQAPRQHGVWTEFIFIKLRARARVCVCVCACVRACACARACVQCLLHAWNDTIMVLNYFWTTFCVLDHLPWASSVRKSWAKQLMSIKLYKFAIFSSVTNNSLASGKRKHKKTVKGGSFDFLLVVCLVCRNWDGSQLVFNKVCRLNWIKRSCLDERFKYSWSGVYGKVPLRQSKTDVRKGWEQVISKFKRSDVGRGSNEQELGFDLKIVAFSSASVIGWNEWKLESTCWSVSLHLVSDNDCWSRSAQIDWTFWRK